MSKPNSNKGELLKRLTQLLRRSLEQIPGVGMVVKLGNDWQAVCDQMRQEQAHLALAERVAQLEELATFTPVQAREKAQAEMTEARQQGQTISRELEEAVLELASSIPATVRERTQATLRQARRHGTAMQTVLPLGEGFTEMEQNEFYRSLLPARRSRFREHDPVPHGNPQWRLVQLIGAGGFGEVWEVRHQQLDDRFAVKFCQESVSAMALKREAEALFRLRKDLPKHPNIVRLEDLQLDQEPYWLAFEYVRGGTLEALMRAKTFTWNEALVLFLPLLEGMSAVHSQGIIHRDLKPANILLTAEGVPKIADFGIGKVTAEQEVKLTQTRLSPFTSLGFGTPGCISPEQEDGQPAHPADDTYSLAVILWQLLHHTLKPPRYLRASLEDLEIPSEAKLLILECLELPRQKRPQSAGELLQRLQPLVPEEEQQRVQGEVQTLQQELQELESRLQTAVSQKAAARQRELEQQKLRKQQELAQRQQQAKDWSRRAGYEEALVQDKEARAQLEAAAAGRLAKLRQQVEEKRRAVQQVESHQLQPAREELVRVEKSLAEIEGQYVQEKQTQQGQLEQSLRQALAELGEFQPAPRDRFEFEQEYQDRLAREKAEYDTQRTRLVAFWQQALQEMEKTLAASHQQTVATLQQQQATLLALQFEIPPAQLSLQLVDYDVNTQQLPIVLVARGILPLQIIQVNATLSIARDPAKECWQHAELLLPYLILRLEQGGQLAVIMAGFETPESQRYTVDEATLVVLEDKEEIAREQQKRREAEEQKRREAEEQKREAEERKRREAEAEENRKGQLFTFETVLVDRRGQIIKRDSRQARQVAIDLGKGVKLEMVHIPAGTFLMGATPNEAGASSDEYPQHQVTLKSFCMGKYPVTQAQWQALMDNNPSRFKGENRPVENVSWQDAKAFCDRLSQRTSQTFRLPSEAEWEYACRAGTTTPFYVGETITPDLVNYDGNHPYGDAPKGKYRQETTPVGSFPPNAFGLYDMHGNVWEWCEDVWHENYEGASTDGSAWGVKKVKKEGGFLSNLFGNSEKEENRRLLRGGSWDDNAVWCRAAYRSKYTPDSRHNLIGLRVVLCAVWTL